MDNKTQEKIEKLLEDAQHGDLQMGAIEDELVYHMAEWIKESIEWGDLPSGTLEHVEEELAGRIIDAVETAIEAIDRGTGIKVRMPEFYKRISRISKRATQTHAS